MVHLRWVAVVDIAEGGLCRANIYRGVVVTVQKSLNAAFIDFGEPKHDFLAGHDSVGKAYHRSPPKGEQRPRVEQVLEKGKPILVQVTKDAMGSKGAALTTNLSLAGRYLVLTPFDSMRGLSRKVEDESEGPTASRRYAARLSSRPDVLCDISGSPSGSTACTCPAPPC